MTNEIKQRIEQINRGEVPIGYKTTAVGIVPVEWEERRLEDFCTIIGGGTPATGNCDFWNGNIPWISSSDITEKSVNNINISRFITTSAIQNSATKICPKGSILIVSRVGVGKIAISPIELCTSQDFTNIIKSESDKLYLTYLLKKKIIDNLKYLQGTSIKGITIKEIKSYSMSMPDLKEQQKIADILSKWDEAVSLQEHLIKNLEKQKKSLMQKLLSPKEGWKPSKLGDCIKLQNGFAFKSQDFCTEGVAIVRISNITEKKVDLNNCPHYSGAYINDEFIVKKGDVLIAMSGATTGKIGLYSYDFISYINQRVGKFILTNKVFSYEYITQLLFSTIFENKLKNILITGAQPNISSKDIENIVFVFPNLEEQKKVSKLLAYFDRYTDIQTQKLNKLKNQQKAIQQLLLTGIVRVEK